MKVRSQLKPLLQVLIGPSFRPLWATTGLLVMALAFQGANILWFGVYGGAPVFLVLMLLAGAFLYRYTGQGPLTIRQESNGAKVLQPLPVTLFLLGFGAAALMTYFIAQAFPMDPYSGDIIPTISIYVQRFLDGEQVYTPIAIGKNVYEAGYLPLIWLPYVPAAMLGIDFRLMALVVFAIGLGVVLYRLVWQSALSVRVKAVLTALPWLLYLIFLDVARADVGYTLEPMSYGYHLMFWAFSWHRRPVVKAGGLLLLLLSRYALLLWVPLYLLIVWRAFGWKHVLQVLAWMLIIGGGLYMFFLGHDPLVVVRSQQTYVMSALQEWAPDRIWHGSSLPYHLGRGRGFACWYYSWGGGDLLSRVEALRQTHLALLAVALLAMAVAVFRVPKHKLFAAMQASVVVYLAIFLLWLQVPYGYLFGNLTWWLFAALLAAMLHRFAPPRIASHL